MDKKRKPGWAAYTLAVFWAAFLILAALAVPRFYEFYAEQQPGIRWPLISRLVLIIPAVAWIVLAVAVPAAVIWLARYVSPKRAPLVEPIVIIVLGVAMGAVIVGLFLPLTDPTETCFGEEPEYIIPPPR